MYVYLPMDTVRSALYHSAMHSSLLYSQLQSSVHSSLVVATCIARLVHQCYLQLHIMYSHTFVSPRSTNILKFSLTLFRCCSSPHRLIILYADFLEIYVFVEVLVIPNERELSSPSINVVNLISAPYVTATATQNHTLPGMFCQFQHFPNGC